VVMEQVKVDGEVVFEDGRYDKKIRGLESPRNSQTGMSALRFGQGRGGVMEIRYTANTFVAPDKARFKYKLEGHDADWRTVGSNERVAYYTNLRPGDYNFRVKACNNHGVWNEVGASLSFSVPPRFTQTVWFPVLCALGLVGAGAGFGFWRMRWQRRVLLAEQSASLERERARIARDLHDDLGTALTGLALEADLARRKHANGSAPALERISSGSRELADRMREVVWAINPRCDDVDNLAGFFAQYAEEFLGAAGLRCRFELQVEIEGVSLGAEARHQLFSAFKESLHNVVKHARASTVELRIEMASGSLNIEIVDDGNGFCAGALTASGNCLRNMRERLNGLGGEARIEQNGSRGTRVIFCVPIERLGKNWSDSRA